MEQAPLFEDVADAPTGGAAHWLTTSDGLRIRAAHWTHDGAKGTVLLFPGRTEYIEKYGRAACELRARGYATLIVDWRGQGIADRLAPDRGLGHVNFFADYQHDVAALLTHARQLGLPEPYYLLAHSMGGCIGLRALTEGLPVKAAAFSAPMWGIQMSAALRPFAWGVSTIGRRMGLGTRVSPGEDTTSYLGTVTLAENALTNDAEMFEHMQNQITQHPDLGLGGPSLLWLNEALLEMRRLTAMPAPRVPALTFLGTDETIVDPARIRSKMAKWPDGKLEVIHTGKHEMLMESPAIKDPIYDDIAAHFDANT